MKKLGQSLTNYGVNRPLLEIVLAAWVRPSGAILFPKRSMVPASKGVQSAAND
jgi:hypothetical protein